MIRIHAPRLVAMVVASLTFAVIASSVWLPAGFASAPTIRDGALWQAFALLGCALGLGSPRVVLRIVASIAVLAGSGGIGGGAALLASGLCGFGIATLANRWLDGFTVVHLPARLVERLRAIRPATSARRS